MIVAEDITLDTLDIIHGGMWTVFSVVKLDGVLVVREESYASVRAAEVSGRSMREGNDGSRMGLGQVRVARHMLELLYLSGSALVGNLGLEGEDLITALLSASMLLFLSATSFSTLIILTMLRSCSITSL